MKKSLKTAIMMNYTVEELYKRVARVERLTVEAEEQSKLAMMAIFDAAAADKEIEDETIEFDETREPNHANSPEFASGSNTYRVMNDPNKSPVAKEVTLSVDYVGEDFGILLARESKDEKRRANVTTFHPGVQVTSSFEDD